MQYWIRRFRGPVAGQALRVGDRVFVVAGEREERAYAFDLERGREIWSSRTGRVLFEPAFADGVLLVANEEGQLLALSTRSGETLWEVRPGGPPAIPPFVAGGHVLLATRRDTLYRIDPGTRAVSAKLALGSTPSASAVVHGDLAILPLHSGEVVAVAVRDFSASWRVTLPASSLAPAVVGPRGDTYVLTRSADVWRVPAEGGAPERVVELGGAVSASFTSTRDGLLIGRLDGALFHVAFDGRIIWRYDFEDSIVAPVVAHGGALYVPLLRGDLVKLR
jgi:outer membrane protein assembly factor BamB